VRRHKTQSRRRRFFVRQGALLRNACINQNRQAERQINLSLKSKNLLLFAVFKNADVVFG